MSRGFFHAVTLTGTVLALANDGGNFLLRTRSKDDFYVYVTSNTWFKSLKNLDEQPSASRDRYADPGTPNDGLAWTVKKYLAVGSLVTIEGVLSRNELKVRVDARTVHLLYQQDNEWIGEKQGAFAFEGAHWWLSQLSALADGWLQSLWPNESDNFDFDGYLTHLDLAFRPTDDKTQESATLSRLIFGLSSAFLLTGCIRYYDAAKAGVEFLRKNFRSNSADGTYLFWAAKRVKGVMIMESANGDDLNTIPLYEQIYCLAGLTQFYRISQDWGVLDDIMKTVSAFQTFFHDKSEHGGWFSHVDYATLSPNSQSLGDNRARKNWNSIGDHLPAYLLNLILALEPIPDKLNKETIRKFLVLCKDMLAEATMLIATKFIEEGNNYVQERYHQDWTPDKKYSWQQNRAIVGHNLKISWNLTRVANYFDRKPHDKVDTDLLIKVAEKLGHAMVDIGAVDLFRGGCYDAVERVPQNGQQVDFAWMNTKDFWQQEQGILAYYIMYGRTKNEKFLDYARDMTAFWNIFFLDQDNKAAFFRTNDDGLPYVKDGYGAKGGHAIAGYHAFELNFLAHIYIMSYVRSKPFCLYFLPSIRNVNVLPDGFPADVNLKITRVTCNGIEIAVPEEGYQVQIPDSGQFDSASVGVGHSLCVQFTPVGRKTHKPSSTGNAVNKPLPAPPAKKGKIGVIVESHFDETETRKFEEFFPAQGYDVEYISYLWDQRFAFYTGNDHCDPLYVFKEMKTVNPADYAGFVFIGGYAMDRLRYEVDPKEGEPNHSVAVQFLRKLVNDPHVKIGTICHSLWLFCAAKETLAGRKVTCANNILYDVINAGGIPVYNANKVGMVATHVDHHEGKATIISGQHPGVVDEFNKVFLAEILKK